MWSLMWDKDMINVNIPQVQCFSGLIQRARPFHCVRRNRTCSPPSVRHIWWDDAYSLDACIVFCICAQKKPPFCIVIQYSILDLAYKMEISRLTFLRQTLSVAFTTHPCPRPSKSSCWVSSACPPLKGTTDDCVITKGRSCISSKSTMPFGSHYRLKSFCIIVGSFVSRLP